MELEKSAATSMALRHAFVSMLFALVIAETAIQISILFESLADTLEYRSAFGGLKHALAQENWLVLAPASHLVLAIILVSTSWVGWSRSIQRDDSSDINEIFSIPFLLLLIELLLVVLYFVLVRSVELDTQSASINSSRLITTPSAAPEAFWLMIIFIGYVVWDFFQDCLPRYLPKESRPCKQLPFLSFVLGIISGFFTRCLVSLLCAIATWWVYHRTEVITPGALSAVWMDLALLSIVIWFWLAKILERPIMENVFPWEQGREGHSRQDIRGWRTVASVVLVPVFVTFVWLIG